MAIQPVTNLLLSSCPAYGASTSAVTANASGESSGIIGRIRFNGSGTKTLSAAGGGGIFWGAGAVTFANGGSTLSIGLQDVDLATGLEDGTFDVRGDLVGGVTVPAANSIQFTAMTSGSKTVSNGDLIAGVVELVARAGVDSIAIERIVTSLTQAVTILGLPYGTTDTGALAKSSGSFLYLVIKFDDGTLGWIQGTSTIIPFSTASQSVNSGSSPDEYCGSFIPSWTMNICGIAATLSGITAGETFELILYSDPYGTPTVIQTVTPDPDVLGGAATAASLEMFTIPVTTLVAGTTYAIAFRPTTAAAVAWLYNNLGTGFSDLKLGLPLPSLKMAARTNQTGAFVETNIIHVPLISIDICGLEDGIGGGGGEHSSAL